MKVIDAVCMSMAIPLIFSAYEHDGYTFVDGGTQESLPATVFLDKKPHEVFCVRMKSTTVFREKIRNHADFFEALINSSLANRPAPGADRMRIVDLDVDPWTAETPTLYRIVTELVDANEAVVEAHVTRVGFRRVELAGRRLLINGVPIKVRSGDRLDFTAGLSGAGLPCNPA